MAIKRMWITPANTQHMWVFADVEESRPSQFLSQHAQVERITDGTWNWITNDPYDRGNEPSADEAMRAATIAIKYPVLVILHPNGGVTLDPLEEVQFPDANPALQ